MTVTVRAFAGLRELVGGRTTVEADSVAEVLEVLAERHGDEFTRRMERAQIVVGEDRVERTSTARLGPDTEVVLLPPFAGG